MKIEEAIKQKEFNTVQEKAWINMLYTFNQLTDRSNQVFKQFGLTKQQYNVLRILRGRSDKMTCCAEVKEVMLDKNPDLTRLCDRLLAKNLIKREINENNRREIGLAITEEGLKLLDKIQPELDKHSRFLDNLSDNEATQFSDLLDKLRS